MQARLPRKCKRFLTQPSERAHQASSHPPQHCTLQQLKLQVAALDGRNDHSQQLNKTITHPSQHSRHYLASGPARVSAKRPALRRLPELGNLPQASNGKEAVKNTPYAPLFKRSNPLLVVNTLFQIAKEDVQSAAAAPPSSHYHSQQKYRELDQTMARSVKVPRGPRILDNELTRLTQKAELSRRRICSEGKARPKVQKEQTRVELVTFYRPKEEGEQQDNQFLL